MAGLAGFLGLLTVGSNQCAVVDDRFSLAYGD
jgi:hypothetical protein